MYWEKRTYRFFPSKNSVHIYDIIRAEKHTRSLHWYGASIELKIWFLHCSYRILHRLLLVSLTEAAIISQLFLLFVCETTGGRLYNLGWPYPSLPYTATNHPWALPNCCKCVEEDALRIKSWSRCLNDFYFFNSHHTQKVPLFIDCVINSLLFGYVS